MAAIYKSYPLDPERKQIRVCQIEAASSQKDPLRGSLRVIDLQDAKDTYTALSYVWGEDSKARPQVVLGEHRVDITENCRLALWHLRHKLGSFTIWVDAICIDQASGHAGIEKEKQIALMPEIYAAASGVYIWLGVETVETNKAMAYIQSRDLQKYEAHRGEGPPYEVARPLGQSLINPLSTAYPAWYYSTKRASSEDLINLLDSPYLQRVWTYQEILFAKKPIIVCGQQHIDWHTMEDALLLLSSLYVRRLRELATAWLGLGRAREMMKSDLPSWKLKLKQEFMDHALSTRLHWRIGLCICSAIAFMVGTALTGWKASLYNQEAENCKHLCASDGKNTYGGLVAASIIQCIIGGAQLVFIAWQISRHWQQRHNTTSIASIVAGISQRRATLPEDMVYGVCNVLRKLGAVSLPEKAHISATSCDDLYWRLATSLLQTTKDLNILRLACLSPLQGSETPSWVPDWARHVEDFAAHLPLQPIDMQGQQLTSVDKADKLLAQETANSLVQLNESHRVLTVSSRELGTVHAGRTFEKTTETFHEVEIDKHIHNLELAVRLMPFLRKLDAKPVWLLGPQDRTNSNLDAKDYNSWLSALPHAHPISDHKLRQLLCSLAAGQYQPGFPTSFMRTHLRACNLLAKHRITLCMVSLQYSDDRRIVALCQNPVQSGDCIVKIQGVLQPLVVRKIRPMSNDVVLVSTIVAAPGTEWVSSQSLERPAERFDIH